MPLLLIEGQKHEVDLLRASSYILGPFLQVSAFSVTTEHWVNGKKSVRTLLVERFHSEQRTEITRAYTIL